MKNMKKKIAALVCVLVFCVALSSCKAVEYTAAEQYAADMVEGFVTSLGENQTYLPQILDQYAEYPMNYDSIVNFMEVAEQYGSYISYETESVTEVERDEYSVRGLIHFEDADVESIMDITVAVASENRVTGEVTYQVSDATAVRFDKVKSFGEKMANAGMNTLMGMGVVFIVLILISFIISLFAYINKFETAQAKKKEEKKKKNAPAPAAAAPKKEAPAPAVQDDTELIAVIAAAIAAYEGTSPDGIVVRSIRKVSSAKTWKRG